MKIRKDEIPCFKCSQTSTRRWNIMIHIDRRHPEIGGAANPIRLGEYPANIPIHKNKNTIHDLSRTLLGLKHQLTMHNPDDVPHKACSAAMPIYNTMTDGLLRQFEEDRREELTAKRKERERIHLRELIEDYQTILKINEIENRKRMWGNLGFGTMNEISSLMAAGIITPVVAIDNEGSILIRYEQGNRLR